VVEVNPSLSAEAEMVNGDPYGRGWLIKVKLSSPEELDELLDAEAYGTFIQE
jgi:glycine cleavage system H protein